LEVAEDKLIGRLENEVHVYQATQAA